MTSSLELAILRPARDGAGFIGGFAITDRTIVAVGGTSSRGPTVLASADARGFERWRTPRELGLRDALAVGDAVWVCGEYGQLAQSRDRGATWRVFDTGSDVCLFALALAPDGAVWVVGDRGYAARVLGERPERVELGTRARLSAVYPVRDQMMVLCGDGALRTWRSGEVGVIATGATRLISGFAHTRSGTWIVVGDGGFISRSPDGAWFARAASGVEVDLEAIAVLDDGRVLVVGDAGHVLISADDGRTWNPFDVATDAHLWAIERHGEGVVIGGDSGLVLRLAPPPRAMDAVLAPGPGDFVARLPERDDVPDDAAAFAEMYGVPVPPEVAKLRRSALELADLALAERLVPEAPGDNVFEALVRRGGTALVEAFCGLFELAHGRGGDTYHVELEGWDGPRQVVCCDGATHSFAGVVADSVDSFAFGAALMHARAADTVSREAFASAVRALRGKIAPRFAIEDHDRDFVRLDPKRRDTELFYYRARWICALLEGRDDFAKLFVRDLNHAVPRDQLPARFEACERAIPTALYALWRAFLLDEPELARYLEIGRAHRARLVRDAARLIDDLRAGKSELPALADLRARLGLMLNLDDARS